MITLVKYAIPRSNTARLVMLQTCHHLPPEFQASAPFNLSGIIVGRGPEEKWAENLNQLFNLIATLPAHFQATALCALADASSLHSLCESTKLESIRSMVKQLPGQLQSIVFAYLVEKLSLFYGSPECDVQGLALLSAGKELPTTVRVNGLCLLPKASKWMSKTGAATLLQSLCDASKEMLPHDQGRLLAKVVSRLTYPASDPRISEQLIPLVSWLSNTATQLPAKYQALIQKKIGFAH